ncbi:pilus assembly protein CpaB [Desulfonatronum thiosulfatophilum]|uniref:Pilus assembly protein CpaB n=1 Tax=Desulfonatronum thiosulfatophilum TaxID=617002 RepID=A0A1G6C898_9BACT|nr:Flp pilus assembly protein CpaB [Desulfonatronum thiosulfatophilum]SDB29097.1 pilus assembly protein CpaB [Desulfonatronum thiosulfatophilum]
MDRWKAFIPITLAMFIAVGGSLFIYNWMQQQTTGVPARVVEEIQRERPETAYVAVAAFDLAAGTRLDAEMITSREHLLSSLPAGHFREPSELLGRVAVVPLRAGETIIEHRLAPVDIRTGGVSAILGEGKRAVAVGGDKVIGISGFIHPGNKVDVLVTWSDPDNGDEDITKIVLENVTVLATGTVMQETEKGTTAPVDVYTLELTPEETEILTHVRNHGRLQFALRSPVDSLSAATRGATARHAMSYLNPRPVQLASNPAPRANNPSPAPVRSEFTMEVIQGSSVQQFKFNQ